MISLKKEYNTTRDKAIQLMSNGKLAEYIEHLKQLNDLKLQLRAINN